MTDARLEFADVTTMTRAVPRKPFIGASLLALLATVVALIVVLVGGSLTRLIGFLMPYGVLLAGPIAIVFFFWVCRAIVRSWTRQLGVDITPVRGGYLALAYIAATVAMVGTFWVSILLLTWLSNSLHTGDFPLEGLVNTVSMLVLGWAVGHVTGYVLWDFYDQRLLRLYRTGVITPRPAPMTLPGPRFAPTGP